MGRGRGRPKKKVSSPTSKPLELELETERSDSTIEGKSGDEKLKRDEEDKRDVSTHNKGRETEIKRDESPKKLWVDVISGNRVPENGLAIEFVAPTMVDGEAQVEIEIDDVVQEMQYWEASLIMYAMGKDLSMYAVKQFMGRAWNHIQLPNIFYNEEGFFILKFRSIEDKDLILMKGPYTIHNVPMILRDWSPDFNFKRDSIRTLPLWVKLPQLPLHLWGARSLGKIGSVIGKPLYTDECTANKLRVSYARILVEVDITLKQRDHVMIKDRDGKMIKQVVEFEWKPKYCGTCLKTGHDCQNEIVKNNKVWQEKKSDVIVTQKEVEKQTLDVVITPGGQLPWTQVGSSGRGKGKTAIAEAVNSSVDFSSLNGFQTLGGWQDPGGSGQ
ncbi:uncharacterized protein LOC131643216 [Vicia villosa]|uniref:uncharacterized protein LOC131643216 n=1 Tax=Vicia villosa TaxID=3911 RepID=UPI00273B7402|nr:uncharacterized protein LOC131643216 [Vicia villosa]